MSEPNWVRIDQTHRLQNPAPEDGVRVYGLDGALWPRLSLTVYRNRWSDRLGHSFEILCGFKKIGGGWWSTPGGVPISLMSEIREMLDEVEARGE